VTEIPLAFYAPLKSPCHSSPSGDRTMARLLMAALAQAGFAPRLASAFRSYEAAGDPARQRTIRDAALNEADDLARHYAAGPADERPRLWFTYHPYYKAPDWLGPAVARRLAIPYVAAEASRADKRAGGSWDEAHRGVEAALAQAAVLFALTPGDRAALERRQPAGQRIVDLPPFLDLASLEATPRAQRRDGPVRLVTVAMMRPGDKLSSYRLLAQSLALIRDEPWTLDIVGDGAARAETEALFRPFGDRVRLHGQIDARDRLATLYAGADLFVWPAVNEAYGMVLLEAQAMGCPVLAGGFGGVGSVMQPGLTGLMPPPGDIASFAADLSRLIADPALRERMGAAASRFVREERGLETAAAILRGNLVDLCRAHSA
jgi:glycosyltransferase involved in cell wall biosynthesis